MKRTAVILMVGLFFLIPGQAQVYVPQVEPLLGLFVLHKGVHLQVESGGCTSVESFDVRTRVYRKTIQITFIRVVPDTCLGLFRDGELISYSFEDLGLRAGDRFQIMNQIQVPCVEE